MKRRTLLRAAGLLAVAPLGLTLLNLRRIVDDLPATEAMPVLFVGHGNPMNAISDNPFAKGWAESIAGLRQPSAILCISAHWETKGSRITAMPMPKTIHDFYGFPEALHQVQYPAPGHPELANELAAKPTLAIAADHDWGLDHGTWSVLCRMYPEANIPVLQLSLDKGKSPQEHYDLAKELAYLRRKGVLIVGSGNIVHNLAMANLRDDTPYEWAVEFDELSKKLIREGRHDQLIDYRKLGRAAQLSIPTAEHYLPLLYALALQEKDEPLQFFNEAMVFRSGSMRSLRVG